MRARKVWGPRPREPPVSCLHPGQAGLAMFRSPMPASQERAADNFDRQRRGLLAALREHAEVLAQMDESPRAGGLSIHS